MEKVKRKLVAILAADAVGYSRHMGTDEEGTLRVLAAHRAVIDGIIDFHDGRLVGTAGDSVLAEFASPVEAVRCAVEIQDALRTRNDSLPEARRLQFRIGVNLGDVVVKGDDLLGDGVNVAARLESIAETGGICISSSVYDQISGKLDLGFVEIGEQKLKNIDRPIRAYRVAAGGRVLAETTPSAPAFRKRAAWPWFAAGGVVIAVVVIGMAWQLRPSSPPQPATASSPSSQADDEARRAVEAKAQAGLEASQRAEAQAKAEAEAAKARADAELAKARVEEQARAQAEIAKARAEAGAAKANAEAVRRQAAEDAASARIRQTEAEFAKARAEEQAKAQAEIAKARAEAQLAKADAEAVRRQAAGEDASVRAQRGAEAKTGGAARPDSAWVAQRICESFENLREFTDTVPVNVSGDHFMLEKGMSGQPGYILLQGRRAADGSMTLQGSFVSGRTGREVTTKFQGRFDGESYEAKGRMGPRQCTLTIVRRPG